MPIIEREGDIFSTPGKIYAQGVNCRGVWGAGIAKQFKQRYPELFREYRAMCGIGYLKPGMTIPVGDIDFENDGVIVFCLATQDEYGGKQPAKLEWVRESAKKLNNGLLFDNIRKIKMPRIGCGLGGLDWADVKPILEEEIDDRIEVEVWSLK